MTTAIPARSALDRRRRRALSAVAVALVSTLVGAVAHATAGGGWPNLVTLVAAVLGSAFLTLPFVGTRMRSWRIALAVAADQVVFHLLFSTLGSAVALDAVAGHGHHGDPLGPLHALPTATAGLGMGMHHVVAGALSFALLRGGWHLVLRALRRGTAFVRRAFAPDAVVPVPTPPAPAVWEGREPGAPALDALRHEVSRRGPPVLVSLG